MTAVTRGAWRHALGRRAEDAVARWLVERGYDVLERNVRVGHLEVDLIARRGEVVVVVEVRHRGERAWQGPFESVTNAKRLRIRKAGEQLWRTRFLCDESIARMRFDVASVEFGPSDEEKICYVEAAF